VAGDGAERRRSQRFPCTLDTSCRLVAAVVGDPHILRVRNISAGGISLIFDKPVEPETMLYVELLNRPRSFLCMIRMRVLYCVEHPQGAFIVGAHFIPELSPEQMDGLLS
jgi:hypothetical protein